MPKKFLKFILLVLILLIPVVIFLFLKGAGENKFSIPVYYEAGIPERQKFDCDFPSGQYRINWPDSLQDSKPALMFFSDESEDLNDVEKRNMIRRISENAKTDIRTLVFYTGNGDINVSDIRRIGLEKEEFMRTLHCLVASDTLNQFILADEMGRIRGYYGTSLREQDRLLVELKILAEE